MNIITLVYAYYNNPCMLQTQIANWQRYTVPFKLILVDDGSQDAPLEDVWKPCGLQTTLFRVANDIPWNQDGARNLAMKHCQTPWAFLSDMDHVLTPTDAEKIAAMPLETGHYYTPRRVDLEGIEVKRHFNSFLIEQDAFWATGGYDEDFCGWYSGDLLFKRNRDALSIEINTHAFDIIRYHENECSDACSKLGRKNSKYAIKHHPRFAAKMAGGAYKAINPIRFQWTQISP